jgi:hypothetical protein
MSGLLDPGICLRADHNPSTSQPVTPMTTQ